jgi:SRSO17 transposase
VAHALPTTFWYRRTVAKGTKGPITYEFARKRIMLCKDGSPTMAVWLLIKRTLGAHPQYWYYLSNAPVSTPLRLFVWLSGVRWAIEQSFEETKTELGMDHYEVRKYSGWHHHMLTCMLAHFFLWHLQSRLEKKAPALTVSQVRRLLEVVLPLKVFQADDVLQLVAGMQQRQHRAYRSHRKRRLHEIAH